MRIKALFDSDENLFLGLFRKSKIRYALVDEEDSPKIKRKGSDDNGNIVIFHEQGQLYIPQLKF